MLILASVASAQQGVGRQVQPSAHIIAQAYDRCMATYAVRLTKTAASDDEIFRTASTNCAPLMGKLADAIKAEIPPAQASEILNQMEASGKPNFYGMLARIRSDRAKREGG